MGEGNASTTVLSSIVTAQMISGVLNEIVQLLPIILPIILPALIGFIAIRKGIGFLLGSLRSA